jgi:hypothetical protein
LGRGGSFEVVEPDLTAWRPVTAADAGPPKRIVCIVAMATVIPARPYVRARSRCDQRMSIPEELQATRQANPWQSDVEPYVDRDGDRQRTGPERDDAGEKPPRRVEPRTSKSADIGADPCASPARLDEEAGHSPLTFRASPSGAAASDLHDPAGANTRPDDPRASRRESSN